MKPPLPDYPRAKRVALITLVGGSLLFGSVSCICAQEAEPPFERCSRILRFGELHGNSEPTKLDAVHALGLLGDPRAVPLLVAHLENEGNANLRLQIVRALGWIGSDAATPALEKSLKDKYPFVRQQSAVALKKITGKEFGYDRAGLPDPTQLRQMADRAREEQKANKAPEPTTTSVTSPAAQEPRQP